jgi:hypothetical protein
VTFEWYDASMAQSYQLVYQDIVAAKDFFILNDYVVLEEGDVLRVETESASTFSIIVTIELEGSQRA